MKINNADINFKIPVSLFLETVLMKIRGKTISYASWKKRQEAKEEANLENIINNIQTEINTNFQNVHENTLKKLHDAQTKLESIRYKKTEGAYIRSRSVFYQLGKKPTAYFYSLETKNFTSKTMIKLETSAGIITSTREILKEQRQFYQTLYSYQSVTNSNINDLIDSHTPKLDKNTADKLEGKICMSELLSALKKMKNNKSPGLDGFTVEFF